MVDVSTDDGFLHYICLFRLSTGSLRLAVRRPSIPDIEISGPGQLPRAGTVAEPKIATIRRVAGIRMII